MSSTLVTMSQMNGLKPVLATASIKPTIMSVRSALLSLLEDNTCPATNRAIRHLQRNEGSIKINHREKRIILGFPADVAYNITRDIASRANKNNLFPRYSFTAKDPFNFAITTKSRAAV